MKRFLVCFTVFTAMFFIVGCGGSDGGSSDGGYSGGGSYSECYSGDRRCSGSYSYYCDGGYWANDEYCSNGCNSSTGRCNSSSDSGNSGGGNSSESSAECRNGKYQCQGNYSYYCENEHWAYDDDCGELGCDSGTGQCNKGECTSGEWTCAGDSGNWSCPCNGGHWANSEDECDMCIDGCNASTGECVNDSSKCTSVGGKMWSDVFTEYDTDYSWDNAVYICDKISQCGHNDWHLPTIGELRALSSCGLTSPGGSCGVTDYCLSSSCDNQACAGCDANGDSSGCGFNKLCWDTIFWSSSEVSDDSSKVWIMNFYGRALVGSLSKYQGIWSICVR
ncbi:DUF1566 domain-containing protein [bacterium]|nr:DUF1566 domain-containing protein [bacterium]